MFDNIIQQIDQWIKDLLKGVIESNLSEMFRSANDSVSEGHVLKELRQ